MLAGVLAVATMGLAWAGTFDVHQPGRFYKALSSPEPVVRNAARSVVVFERGTGFVVSRTGHVLTNFHVAELEGAATSVVLSSGRSVDMRLVAANARFDVALYRRTEPLPATSWIELRADPVRRGESVAVIGNPDGMPLRVSFGEVVDTSLAVATEDHPPSIGYTAATWWGSSGSPVVDREGRAVAVHWGWDRYGDQPFAGVPLHQVLGGFPELTDALSACPEPARSLTMSVVRSGARFLAELEGPRACLERLVQVHWVDALGARTRGRARRRGRARVWPPPVEALVGLEAGQTVRVARTEPVENLSLP
ncbi:MAG: serine protease [Myxococcales bacterium]|nr:serine protease [Myxococcales bacterium]